VATVICAIKLGSDDFNINYQEVEPSSAYFPFQERELSIANSVVILPSGTRSYTGKDAQCCTLIAHRRNDAFQIQKNW